jgi:hypothetical protein
MNRMQGSRRRVITRLEGGLGNQLFQYAAAVGTGTPSGAQVIIDSRQHRTWGHPLRSALNPGLTREASFRDLLAVGWPPQQRAGRAQRVKDRCCRRVAGAYLAISSDSPGTVAPAGPFDFVDMNSAEPGPLYLRGYFQDERYFVLSNNRILDALSSTRALGEQLAVDIQRKHHTRRLVGVSFRLGYDYGFFGWVLPREYYALAFSAVIESDAVYVIFSDVPVPGVKHLFPKGSRLELAPSGSAVQLGLLANMNSIICANSTFSWWGAWLAEQAGFAETIVVPEPWINLPGSPAPARWSIVKHAGHLPVDVVDAWAQDR